MRLEKLNRLLLQIVTGVNRRRGLDQRVQAAMVQMKDQESLLKMAQYAARHGLITCTLGEISCRIEGGKFLILAENSWFPDIQPNDVILCSIQGDWTSDDSGVPRHVAWHRQLYHATGANAAIFCQPVYATLLAAIGRTPTPELLMEAEQAVGEIKAVDSLDAAAFEDMNAGSGARLIRGMGLYAWGHDLPQVISLTELIERWSELHWRYWRGAVRS